MIVAARVCNPRMVSFVALRFILGFRLLGRLLPVAAGPAFVVVGVDGRRKRAAVLSVTMCRRIACIQVLIGAVGCSLYSVAANPFNLRTATRVLTAVQEW